jgi:hypothetical protein
VFIGIGNVKCVVWVSDVDKNINFYKIKINGINQWLERQITAM